MIGNKFEALILVLMISSCAHTKWVASPIKFDLDSISTIRVEQYPTISSSYSVSKDKYVEINNLFSGSGWQESDSIEIKPIAKVIVSRTNGISSIYWLGANSSQNQFPCYKLCSGYWIMVTDSKGNVVRNVYKSLSTSLDIYRVNLLLSGESSNK